MKYGKVYFLGIGGIGMSAEARYFLHEGRRVAGYDRTPSELTAELRREGAEVTYDESTDAIPAGFRSSDDTLVVYTPAIPEDHPQLRFFRDGGFEAVSYTHLYKRQGQALAVARRDFGGKVRDGRCRHARQDDHYDDGRLVQPCRRRRGQRLSGRHIEKFRE